MDGMDPGLKVNYETIIVVLTNKPRLKTEVYSGPEILYKRVHLINVIEARFRLEDLCH